jgi:hypothetical protein
MSLVIDADGHVEETLPELVDAIPAGMRDSAMQFVAEADGYVTYRIEGRLWRSKYPFPGGLQNHVSAVRAVATPNSACGSSTTRGSTPRCCTRVWG